MARSPASLPISAAWQKQCPSYAPVPVCRVHCQGVHHKDGRLKGNLPAGLPAGAAPAPAGGSPSRRSVRPAPQYRARRLPAPPGHPAAADRHPVSTWSHPDGPLPRRLPAHTSSSIPSRSPVSARRTRISMAHPLPSALCWFHYNPTALFLPVFRKNFPESEKDGTFFLLPHIIVIGAGQCCCRVNPHKRSSL